MRSDPPLLSGTVPGLLDPSQPSRLLRTPSSSLFFAAFDPLTARTSDIPNLSSLHIDPDNFPKRVNPETVASSNGKRIVIETDPENGTCSWRFVPRAKTEGRSLGDEGSFPRLVELCSQPVRMTQDQWDLYKLDPKYDCVVRAHPNLTKITKVTSRKRGLDSDDTVNSDLTDERKTSSTPLNEHTSTPKAKQGSSGACSGSDTSRSKRFKPSMRPKRTLSSQTDRMSVDEFPSYIPEQSEQVADQDIVNPKKRRWDPDPLRGRNTSDAENSRRTTPERGAFANGYRPHPYSGSGSGMNDISNNEVPAKRLRTRSPGTVRRELGKKCAKREKNRRAQMEARLKFRRDILHQVFWDGVGIPPGLYSSNVHEEPNDLDSGESESSADESDGRSSPDNGPTTDGEDEAQRLARIEESRRKLAELEKDKPIWEESARRRQAREKQEEEMRQQAKKVKEEEERRQQQAQAARRQHEEKREKERQELDRETRIEERKWRMCVPPRSRVFWSFRHALDRYLQTAASFDAAKFFEGGMPLTFAAIPWPMLHASFYVQDIQWDAIEKFFGNVSMLLSATEYKDLVEKSHKRFHPDRWRSRGLLLSVKDEMEKDLLEVAGSTVAQAITPLWKKVTGR